MGIKLVSRNSEIESKIYYLRNQKVMLDSDLAMLYGVETKQLKRQVMRNIDRFPDDFMFELTKDELNNLRSQIGTSSWGGTRYLPIVFTEHGVLMLSSVLNSERAVQVNIQIMRIYSKFREIHQTNSDILLKLEKIESALSNHDTEIKTIFNYLKGLVKQPAKQIPTRKRIGFKSDEL